MRRLAPLFTLALSVAATAGAQRPPAAQPPARQGTAILEGEVHDTAGHPLRGASVAVAGFERVAYTDPEGRFLLTGLPSDTIEVAVRRVGYAPAYFAVAIPPDTRLAIAAKMLPAAVQLGTVVVNGQRRDLQLQRDGFYDRRRAGRGVYLDSTFFERRSAQNVATVLREVPRMRVTCRGAAMMCTPMISAGPHSCVPSLWVDGVLQAAPDGFDMVVALPDVKAMEVYRDGSEIPWKFAGTYSASQCGAVVVWTRWTH